MGVKVISRPPDYAKLIGAGLAPTMKKAAMYLQSSANRKINSGITPANAPLTQSVKQGGQTLRDNFEIRPYSAGRRDNHAEKREGAFYSGWSKNKNAYEIVRGAFAALPHQRDDR